MNSRFTRREFVAGCAGVALSSANSLGSNLTNQPALIAITLDLEMSAHYPERGHTEWNYRKGDLDEATKKYAVEAGRVAKSLGGKIHYFCVGRVLEQENVDWLKELAREGHPIGNHTYDHVNVLAKTPDQTQFRFQRAPWLIRGRTAEQLIRDNIEITTEAIKTRLGFAPQGFRTPGGFHDGLKGRADVQKWLLDAGFPWISSLYPAHPVGTVSQKPSQNVLDGIIQAQTQASPFRYSSGLIEVPMSPISDVGAFRTQRWKLDWFLEAIGQAVDWAIRERKPFDFLAHPSCLVVEDPQFETIKLICKKVRQAGEAAKIATLDEIAALV